MFISERNLIVEGPSELAYLKAVSSVLEAAGRTSLRPDVTIVPSGGLDKVVTFVALLGASGLKLAVLHDYHGTPEQKLLDLVRRKTISGEAVFHAAMFRSVPPTTAATQATDIEDLVSVDLYLKSFNATFSKRLPAPIGDGDLPPGNRVVERIERYLEQNHISIRPSGGFNHYTVALEFAARPPTLDEQTMDCFEALFAAINKTFDK